MQSGLKDESRQMKKRCKNKASTVSETVVDGYYVMEQFWDGKDSILGETCNIKSSGKDDRDDRRFESAPCCASVSARFVLLLKRLCSLSHFFTFCLTILSCSRCRVRWSSQTLKVQYDKKKACTHCFKNAKRWYAFCFLDDNMKTTCGTKSGNFEPPATAARNMFWFAILLLLIYLDTELVKEVNVLRLF